MILSLALTLLAAQQVLAWGDLGHSTVGFIAEKNLTPAAKAMLQDILGVEPMAVSAIWPDQVRADDRFKMFAAYHFFEIPQGYSMATMTPEMFADRDARTIIFQGPDKILEAQTSREEKIIWLRYLIHIVGDIHQPLHVGNGLDLGANLCSITWKQSSGVLVEGLNLHSFWDDKLVSSIGDDFNLKNPPPPGTKRWIGYAELADILLKDSAGQISMASANQASQNDWYDESRSYHDLVYPDAQPVKDPADRAYCKLIDKKANKIINGKFSPDKIPVLDDAYVHKALPIVKKRIVLAGYRLANLLNTMALKYQSGAKANTHLGDLSSVMLMNKALRLPQSQPPFHWRAQLPYPTEH